ncbi:MAG: phospholipase [Alphaproteobacteria bacterium]|nr:phospholipase [Alphaproteobacteria bacterium]
MTEGDPTDAVLDAITGLVPALLHGLESLGFAQRHLHPPMLAELVAKIAANGTALGAALGAFRAAPWPEPLLEFRRVVEQASESAALAFAGLGEAAVAPDGRLVAYRALRHYHASVETLYTVAPMLEIVSRFYLEPGRRDDRARIQSLAAADPARPDAGVMHASNEPGTRGGFSLYVPEDYDPGVAHPLIVALHGGRGHGRTFLWSWLREARSRGAILLSPTAVGDTWSLMEPGVDAGNIGAMLDHVRDRWNVDDRRLLLTGMSDGGSFSLLSGLGEGSPFTHLAPIAASFHPLMLEVADPERLAGLPIYLVHGALDWMFPVDMARLARHMLAAAGAKVAYREIADLSHTYPRDENPLILDWFLAADAD